MIAPVKKALNQAGDTIIEVLIAIGVVSTVLSFTYLTVNRNLVLTRVNQERTEASKAVQGQIELLKYVASTAPSTLPATPFCLKSGTAPIPLSGTAPTDDMSADDFNNYPADCKNGFYNFGIKNTAAKTYKFYARWDRVDGKGRDQIIMIYRVE